ncbi:hypothetical protein E0L36_20360 [Streptomyces sp. AJS327]|uniref:hypothetical protein n=1 Tax=Streptomyces sp. AJS327 TaxID=2545265 RepID=UPI0015DEBEB2|nr:hypothetical protein [Streptomyces sp. AJS327]MBA0053138.1 hypothetical protein [Streptomyces sp. AJS327]
MNHTVTDPTRHGPSGTGCPGVTAPANRNAPGARSTPGNGNAPGARSTRGARNAANAGGTDGLAEAPVGGARRGHRIGNGLRAVRVFLGTAFEVAVLGAHEGRSADGPDRCRDAQQPVRQPVR